VSGRAIRVLVVDDDEHLPAALREVLDAQGDLHWVGHAASAAAALSACATHEPDVVVIEPRLAGGDGVSATRAILAAHPHIAVVALSAHSDRRHRALMVAAGAAGYVTKGAPSTELLRTIRDAAATS
jgi:DNA-binding NarL/FixJ family response regulator